MNAKYYSDGRTLMHVAAYGGNLDIVKYFMTGKKIVWKLKILKV
ncbi:ankyrin repeat domain-containing protein [Wolbachia endosymbiont of Diaphorina citri]